MNAPDLAMPSALRLAQSSPAPALAGHPLQAALAAARGQQRGAILYPRLIVLGGTWWRQSAPGAELELQEVQNG